MYDKADVSANDRLFFWIKKLRRLIAGSIIGHILEVWKKEETLGLIEFTIAYRPTEEPQIDPSEIPLVLQRLNGNRPRKELPRFVGAVLGFACIVAGETEAELLSNAENKIRSLIRMRGPNKVLSEPTDERITDQPVSRSDVKVVTLNLEVKER